MPSETSDKKRTPFVMFPDNITDDSRMVRLKRKGGFEYTGLFFQLCFLLHRYREDGFEASMPFDLDDPEAFDDLVYQLYPMDADRIRDAIKLMISVELLESFEADGVQYLCAPVMRDAVLNIKRISQLQSERRRGKGNSNLEDQQPDDQCENHLLSRTELHLLAVKFKAQVSKELVDRFYDEVVAHDYYGRYTEENVGEYYEQWVQRTIGA